MKPTPISSLRTVPSTRDVLALAALFSAAHVVAAEAPANKKADADKKDKKKADGEVLPDLVVDATRENTYKTEALSSQKYTVPLRDVPQTVIAIPRKVIEEQGATTLTEVLRNVPGITMNAGENGVGNVAGETFFLRGFDGTNSLFLDGVRDDGLASRDTFNVENVEVFLGPTGSDVGRGNATGYVNQSTKAPHLENDYQGSASYTTGDRYRLTADANQEIQLGKDGWIEGAAVRVNGLYQYGGVPGRDEIERNTWAIAPSIAFGLGTATRTTLFYQHIEQDNIPDYGIPGNLGKRPDGVDRDWFYGNPDTDYEDITQDTFTARIEHDINEKITIRNQTRYNEATRESIATRAAYAAATSSATRTLVSGDRENQIFSNQTSITAKFDTGSLKHSLVGGLEYTDEEQDTYTIAGLGTYAPISIGEKPSGRPVGYDPYRNPDAISNGETETIGLYAFDTVEITPKWLVTGGLRVDRYRTDNYAVSTTNARTDTPTAEDTVYSGKLGVTFKPVEEGSIYFGYGRTVTPPGTGNFSVNATTSAGGTVSSNANVNADPQESQNFELGTKWDFFASKLTLTGAVFYTENTNVIYRDDVNNVDSYSTDGGQQILGATLGATGQITENWQIISSVSWLDGTLDQPDALNGIDGRDLARTPHYAATLWTTYKLPKGFTIGGGFRWTDSVNTSTATSAVEIPGYSIFDAMVQYDVSQNANVRLNVYNVFDKEYALSTGGGGGTQRMNLGAPISFMLSTNFRF